MTIVRRLTRTIRSIGAKTRMTPGPLGCGNSLPRRKMTPRSYSARILIELKRYRSTIRAKMKRGGKAGIVSPFSVLRLLHGHGQSFDRRDADLRALRNRCLGARPPYLPVRLHAART